MPPKIGEDQRAWMELAEAEGWSVKITERGHLVFVPPVSSEDRRPVVVPGRKFKAVNRGAKNARSELRKRGLSI